MNRGVTIMKSLKQYWQDMKDRSFEKQREREGYKYLCDAIIENNLTRAKAILDQGISPGRKFKTSQYNPMALSVVKGSEEMTTLLLQNGGNPNWDESDMMLDIGYSITPYLALAIDHRNEGAAIALAKDGRTNIDDGGMRKIGDKKTYGDKPIDRARRAGMTGLLAVLASREAEVVRKKLQSLEDEAAGNGAKPKVKPAPTSRRKTGDPGLAP